MELLKVSALFALTAVMEIVGCYLPWLVLRQGKPVWLLLPAAVALAVFAWLLTLHPAAAGRTYAAYGGMYIVMALAWLYVVDGVALTRWDWAGAAVALAGMAIIALQPSTLDPASR
ncbi:MAG TPA: YnfA family protein [Burkholderiaceae bacterium]|nr:YnfA family protein [Burkholderiaceae bacterium]